MNRHCHILLIVLIALLGLQACSVGPTVRLTKITSPSDLTGDEIDSFYLRKSLISIYIQGNEKDTGGDVNDIVVTSLVAEHIDFKIGVIPYDAGGIKTNLNITKIENTGLVKEAGVEVKDERIEYINKAGKIITSLLPLLVVGQTKLRAENIPKIIIINDLLEKENTVRSAVENIDAGHGVKLDIGALPPDAEELGSFPNSSVSNGLIYSACRTATIRFEYKETKYSKTMKINDPRYFQRIAFPQKGKISFHSECGVSVQSEKDTGVSTGLDIAEAFAAQGKAIKDAIDAAKKEDKTE